jgi:hypothetical protein
LKDINAEQMIKQQYVALAYASLEKYRLIFCEMPMHWHR